MGRIRIKHDNPTSQGQLKLLQILATQQIYVTKIITTKDGYITLTKNDEDQDSIFKGQCLQELKANDFQPILPPDLRAKRTILIFNIDDTIFKHEEEEIKDELIIKNTWIEEITHIFKFPKHNIVKICFSETATAKKATETGLLAFYMSIPSYNIKQEEYVHINTCMKCYKIEDHFTRQCPKDKEYKICSECGSLDHTWRECPSNSKKCINCEGSHRTLANNCPIRKKIREDKLKEKREGKKATYSQAAASGSAKDTLAPTSNISLGKDTAEKIKSNSIRRLF